MWCCCKRRIIQSVGGADYDVSVSLNVYSVFDLPGEEGLLCLQGVFRRIIFLDYLLMILSENDITVLD